MKVLEWMSRDDWRSCDPASEQEIITVLHSHELLSSLWPSSSGSKSCIFICVETVLFFFSFLTAVLLLISETVWADQVVRQAFRAAAQQQKQQQQRSSHSEPWRQRHQQHYHSQQKRQRQQQQQHTLSSLFFLFYLELLPALRTKTK